MPYFYQHPLLPFEEFQKTDRGNRLVLVLEALDTEPLLRKLTQERRGRRDHYPVQAMWKTIIAGIVYKKATVTGLIEELEINPGLRLLCGISSVAGVPSASAYSRFLGKLVRHEDELMAIFHRLVEALRSKLSGLGETLAIDSTDIHSWSSGRGEPPSDPDARWSGKTKGKKDGDGRPNMYWWFGYKLHLAVCGEYEIPVAFTVTPATGDDGHQVKPLLEQLEANHPELLAGTEYVIADKGYDSSDVCELLAKEHEKKPIIPLRLMGDKEPFGICNYHGTPICLGNLEMSFSGYDNGYLKYRCPAKCKKGVTCPLRVPCRPLEKYGCVVKLKIKDDYRRLTAVPRETKKWRRLYKKRSAVERVNGRLKEHLLADDLRVRGIGKTKVRLGLSLLVLLAGAVAMASRDRRDEVRRIVQLAAA